MPITPSLTRTSIQEAFDALGRYDFISARDRVTDARHAELIIEHLETVQTPVTGIDVGPRPDDVTAAALYDRLCRALKRSQPDADARITPTEIPSSR